MGEQGDSSPESAAEWAALQRSYVELRTELQLTDDPKEQVELLRRLADYRAQIARLDEAIEGDDTSGYVACDDRETHGTERPVVRSDVTAELPATSRLGEPLASVTADAGREVAGGATSMQPQADATQPTTRPEDEGNEDEGNEPPAALSATIIDLRPGVSDSVTEPDQSAQDEPEMTADDVDDPAAVAETAVAEAADGEWPGLTLRFVIEGPPGAGTTTVTNQLAEQFGSPPAVAPLLDGSLELNWFEFSSGSFDGLPIRFEVCSLEGSADRRIRSRLRSMVDAVIMVVDSTPEGLGAATPYLGELQEDRERSAEIDAPELAVFAHKEDLTAALGTDIVAQRLSIPAVTKIVSTTRERPGFLYSFGLATSSAVRRAQRRDEFGLPRTMPASEETFLFELQDGLLNQPAPRPASSAPPSVLADGTTPSPPEAAGGDTAPPAEPISPVADDPSPATANGQHYSGDGSNGSTQNGSVPLVSAESEASQTNSDETGIDEPDLPDTELAEVAAADVTDSGLVDDQVDDTDYLGSAAAETSTIAPPPATTEAADNGVIDLASIGRSAGQAAAANGTPQRWRNGSAGADTTSNGASRLLDESTMNGWGIGSSPKSEEPAANGDQTNDTAEVRGGLEPPPFIANRQTPRSEVQPDLATRPGDEDPEAPDPSVVADDVPEPPAAKEPPPFIAGRRRTRPRSERSIPPSVLDDHRSPAAPTAEPVKPDPDLPVAEQPPAQPRRTRPRPAAQTPTADTPGSLFGPRQGPSGGWPPAPTAEDRIDLGSGPLGPANRAALENSTQWGANGPYRPGSHHGHERRSALRRLIQALKG